MVFYVFGADPEVSSAPMDLQVFKPLKLHPKNNTMVIGSSIQLTTKGGPLPEASIEYLIGTKKIAG